MASGCLGAGTDDRVTGARGRAWRGGRREVQRGQHHLQFAARSAFASGGAIFVSFGCGASDVGFWAVPHPGSGSIAGMHATSACTSCVDIDRV